MKNFFLTFFSIKKILFIIFPKFLFQSKIFIFFNWKLKKIFFIYRLKKNKFLKKKIFFFFTLLKSTPGRLWLVGEKKEQGRFVRSHWCNLVGAAESETPWEKKSVSDHYYHTTSGHRPLQVCQPAGRSSSVLIFRPNILFLNLALADVICTIFSIAGITSLRRSRRLVQFDIWRTTHVDDCWQWVGVWRLGL